MYCVFWQSIFALARQRQQENSQQPSSSPDEIQHGNFTGRLPNFDAVIAYPNCLLFSVGGGKAEETFDTALLLYGSPLSEVTKCDFLYTPEVFGALKLPQPNGNESWYPTPFESIDTEHRFGREYDVSTKYRVYKTLVLRMAQLQRIIKFMDQVRVDTKASLQKRKWAEQNIAALYVWLDAHLMLAMAIDELGYIPRDNSPEMQVLLERYKPEPEMALTETEMPDLSREIRRCAFMSKREISRKDDPIVEALEKAPPERCLTREAAMKCADLFAVNTSYFGWIKLLLAAMYLGVYHTSTYRGGWRYRWSVYRLFFFTMDVRLKPFCQPARMTDGSVGSVVGGSTEYVAREYDLNDLYDSMGIDQVSNTAARTTSKSNAKSGRGGGGTRKRNTRVKKVLTTVQFRHYQTIVGLTHRAQMSETTTRRRSRSAPPPLNDTPASPAKRHTVDDADDVDATAAARGDSLATTSDASAIAPKKKKMAPKLRDAAMRNLTSAQAAPEVLKKQGLTIDPESIAEDNDFKQGIFMANAIGRLGVERNRGVLYFEQRREIYMTHMQAVRVALAAKIPAGDAKTAVPPINEPVPPPEMGEAVKYKDVAKRMIPDDRRMPSEDELQRDSIIFHAISTVITLRSETSSTVEKEYTYQNAINLALRLFLMFGLERWNESMLNELCARTSTLDDNCPRTDWAAWQMGNIMLADMLRCNLDALYTKPCKLGAFLTTYQPYERMKESTGDAERTAIINNLYTLEKETYLAATLRTMTSMLNGAAYADEQLEHTPPTETPIMMRHLLMHWQYPRFAPPIDLEKIPRQKHETAATTTATTGEGRDNVGGNIIVQSKQQMRAWIMPAQLSFLIEPTTRMPAEKATHTEIVEQFVKPARFPLKLFHVDDRTINEFNRHRHDYHIAPSDTIVEDFLERLASRDMYQFLVMYMYLQAVANHMSNRTWPLPRHIVDHQTTTLRSHYCIPADRPVPRHLMKTLVCMGCQRCAAVMPTMRKQQSTGDNNLGAGIDIGCSHVRWVAETDDDIVFEAVRKRGGMLMPLDSMLPAKSWTKVLHHRARQHRHCYDMYCTESKEETTEMLEHPERFGFLPARPTAEEIDAQAHSILGALFDEEFIAKFAEPTDVRTLIAPMSKPGASLHLVASGRGKLGELDFDEKLCAEANRRIGLYLPVGGKMKSFQIWGHTLKDRDRRYDTVRWVDATQRLKAETKKTKQLDNQRKTIDGIVEQDERASRLYTFDAKRRRDAQSMARVAQCGREQMLEVDLYGRALAQEQIFVVGRAQQTADDDFLMACCDCLGKVHASEAYPIADRVVCKPCYTASQTRGGVVAKRTVRGESTKSVTTARLSALSAESAALMRVAPNQRLLSPSFKSLHNCVVPDGTPCAMDRCKRIKSEVTLMYGLQVLRDIDVGNEAYGYIFFCKRHAALYSPLFKSPFVVPLSSIKVFMLEGVRKFDTNLTSGNFLDRYLRSAAQSAHIGTMERQRIEVAKKHKSLMNKKRRQQRDETLQMAAEANAVQENTQALGRKKKAASTSTTQLLPPVGTLEE